MVDEITDLSNTEQMVLCLRYVDVHKPRCSQKLLELYCRCACHCYSRHVALHEFGNQQLSRPML